MQEKSIEHRKIERFSRRAEIFRGKWRIVSLIPTKISVIYVNEENYYVSDQFPNTSYYNNNKKNLTLAIQRVVKHRFCMFF